MNSVSLSGSKRQNVGKKDASLLRREGQIPAVLYGGENQVHFQVSELDATKLVRTPHVYIIELDIDGEKAKAIIQEVQIHPVTDRVLHMDFLLVVDGKAVKMDIPVTLSGFSIGVQNGGKLRQNFRRLKVVGAEKDLPNTIDLDISKLKIGDKTRISDINIPGVELLGPASAVVVAVQMARGAKMNDEEEEEAAEETAEA